METNSWLDGLVKSASSLDPQKKDLIYRPLLGLHWRSHTFASSINEAIHFLKQVQDDKFIEGKLMLNGLEACAKKISAPSSPTLLENPTHPLTRSFKWILGLPKVPKILFDPVQVWDEAIELADPSRAFYEFGVWKGKSFNYFMDQGEFKKGFGFDTFTGLPEKWHHLQAKGALSANGKVPTTPGAEFIKGEFKNTLPKFFSKKRPLASIIHFDADLYSATSCALTYCRDVIDEKTILLFDEFLEITNRDWELDEYKAFMEFCKKFNLTYEVLAVSFCTLQVIIKVRQ